MPPALATSTAVILALVARTHFSTGVKREESVLSLRGAEKYSPEFCFLMGPRDKREDDIRGEFGGGCSLHGRTALPFSV
jgi:hypothetical protein